MITFNSIAETPKPFTGRLFGSILSALGMYVMLGWVFNQPGMVRLTTDSLSMRFNTALGFFLIGLLFFVQSLPVSHIKHALHNLLTLVLLTMLGLVLGEYITGRDFGIDLQNMHHTIADGNPHPGRISFLSCVCMSLIGVCFVGLPRANKQWQVVMITAVPGILIFIVATASLFYDFLDMNELYRFAQYNLMSPPTACGLLIASAGLAFLGLTTTNEFALNKAQYDKQITRVAAVVMLIVTFTVGLSCLVILKKSADLNLHSELQQLSTTTVAHFDETLRERFAFGDFLASAPGIIDRLTKLDDTALRQSLTDWAQGLLKRGYSAVTVYDANGAELTTQGVFDTTPWRNIPITIHGETGNLLWDDGFILNLRRDIIVNGVKIGSIHMEQHLTALTGFYDKMHQMGRTVDTGVCALSDDKMMLCFPARLVPQPPILPLDPTDHPPFAMSYALHGETGILNYRDIRNQSALAAHTPIDGTNLGVVVKMDTVELYAPIRNYIDILLGIIGAMAIIGTLVMRSQVKPLTIQLVRSEQKMQEANQALLRDAKRLNQVILAQEQMVQPSFNLDEVLNQIVGSIQELTNATGAAVELVDGDDLLYRAASGLLRGYVGMRLKVAGSLSGISIDSKQIICSDDTEEDARVNREATRKLGIRSMIVAPLSYEGRIIGVLKVSSGMPKAFSESEKETIKLISGLIATAISRQQNADTIQHLLTEKTLAVESLQQAQRKLFHMAQYDQLTGLPNRALFMDRLHMAIQRNMRNHKAMALMFLDLDGFKGINDRLGHKTGDMVLKAFGERLAGAVRMTDAVARLGGDEFTIILEEITNPDKDVEDIAKKIIGIMSEPFNIDGHFLPLTTSIGICIHRLGPAKPDELIHLADTEMYKAKKSGKNAYNITVL